MNAFYAKAILTLLKLAIPKDAVNHIVELVSIAVDNEGTGEMKRKAVLDQIAVVKGDLKQTFDNLSSNLINLAVEAAVAYVKAVAK